MLIDLYELVYRFELYVYRLYIEHIVLNLIEGL